VSVKNKFERLSIRYDGERKDKLRFYGSGSMVSKPKSKGGRLVAFQIQSVMPVARDVNCVRLHGICYAIYDQLQRLNHP